MINNYSKIAFRSLWKNKVLSFINLGGLAVGIASSILLLSYVSFQFSYDNFHSRKQDIYRVNLDLYQNNLLTIQSAENYSAVGPSLKKDFPEIQEQARLYNMGYKNNCVFSYNSTNFKENKFLYADPSFLTMFSFPFVQGDPRSALVQPFTAVISESTARKLFGEEGAQSALGKFLQMNDDDRNSELCRITGVFKDIPENSHLKFNVLISWPTLHRRGIDQFEHNWDRKDFYTYVLLHPGSDPGALTAKFSSFISRHIPGEITDHRESRLSLQPLGKIHLGSDRLDEPEPAGQGKALGFLVIIAFFIVTIAWVNYINLATAGSVNRAREIGIRKVLGSKRSQLVKQFLMESLGLNTIGFILAILLIYALRPLLHRLFYVDFPLSILFTNTYGLAFITFLLFGAFFSGLYPALVLSAFKPILVLKGAVKASRNGIVLRKSLVVFQFALSILLITGTFIVYQQVHYMLNQDLGIKVNQVMALDRPGRWDTARATHNLLVQRFKTALENDPGVEAVGMSDELPGKEIRWPSNYALKNNAALAHSVPINTTVIDEHYLTTLGMHVLAGRNFSTQFKTDKSGLILTRSAATLLGFAAPEDAIGKAFRSDDGDYTVVGVVNDFYQVSLQRKQTPAAFQFNGGDLREFEYYLVRLKGQGLRQTVGRIQAAWSGNFKGNPFEFSFLDEYFNRQYRSEIQFGILFGIFSLLAIAIACIGLFALVSFMIKQRTKEIGVRKVLGADVRAVFFLLTKDFIKLVLIANLIAWPVGWLLMNHWLEDFANRIHINGLVFVLAGLSALLIAMITISFQAIKAGLTNPVKSLRTE